MYPSINWNRQYLDIAQLKNFSLVDALLMAGHQADMGNVVQTDIDGSNALFLALQNPCLGKAASVLIRTMNETGTISKEDADLMSSFLASCDIPQVAASVVASGAAERQGNKRERDDDGGGGEDDEVQAAAAARTITAQMPESAWVSFLC